MDTATMPDPFDASALTETQRLANVAAALHAYTEVVRRHNGRGRARTYAADRDTIAETGRQLAEMVLAYCATQESRQ